MKKHAAVRTVFHRELAAYFNAPVAYIFIIVFAVLNGALYMTPFFLMATADMRVLFGTLPLLLAVFIPAITMRQWAEEKRGNTLELLLTFPMPVQALVAGKFLAGFVFFLTALAGTLLIPLMLFFLGRPDPGAICGGYFGAALLGSLYLAAGIFISGLCRDQIVSFILAMLVCFGLHLVGTEFLAVSIDGWFPGIGTLLKNFLGSAEHYETFSRGVVDLRDVLYFLTGTVLFLVLNGFWLEGRQRPGARKIFTSAVLICTGIFFTGNWLFSSVRLGRVDLTQGRIHTISPAARDILRGLKTPVTVKFYISPADKMPTGMKSLERDVVDKLNELRENSAGKFQYKIFHMEAANVVEGAEKPGRESMEEQLQHKGIQPFQVQAIDSDEMAVRLVYASMAVSYKEKPEEIIPRLMPESVQDLEYQLMSKIFRMTLDHKPKVTLVAPYEERGVNPQLAALMSQLGGGQMPASFRDDAYEILEMALNYEGYDMERIQFTEQEPLSADADTLVIVEPRRLSDRQLYEISRFLAGGGSVFLAVQQYEYNYRPEGRSLNIELVEKEPGVNALLKHWGLGIHEEILVDDQHEVISLGGAARMGPFQVSIPVKLPVQIMVQPSGMNEKLSMTSRLNEIFYLWGSALDIDEKRIQEQNLQLDVLLKSSSASALIPFKAGTLQPEDFYRTEGRPAGPFPLAVFLRGQFADAYAGAAAPKWSAESGPGPEGGQPEAEDPAAVQPVPGKLILVGDAAMLQRNTVTSGGHLTFFLNSIDALTLGEKLVTIRSKRPVDRSIGRISAPLKAFWRVLILFLSPALIAALGFLRMMMRRKEKQNYLKLLAA
ncbi:MAG: hypothetical protein A2Z83_06430 [Omnitrophica bacterium GWA2_52_8]|nr:MAG: hypothetical protein A2Z83_06430 [Omnitrophica bacterium GWA2_52_8]